jgi:8-amino-3,8-dideoxy-alpha-D-manno-octulosonate transaminase
MDGLHPTHVSLIFDILLYSPNLSYGSVSMTDHPSPRSARQAHNRLAIDGGAPALSQPMPEMYPGGMRIGIEEEQAVLEVLRSKRLFRYYGPNAGPSKVEELEITFARLMGVQYALAVTSGCAALICGLQGLGVGAGDEVIVPAYTWIASASAVIAVGAVPIMAEVDESLTLDPADVERKISPYTRAILPVHMRGAPARMDVLMEVARKHGLKVLEDAAQANGASFQGKRLGSIGDAGAFSLQFNKILTSGEGGILITDQLDVFNRAVMYHDVVGGERNGLPDDQVLPGINFRMPELLGAVALVQLRRSETLLNDMRQRKKIIKDNIANLAASKGIIFRTIHDAGEAAIALVFFAPDAAKAHELSDALGDEGVDNSVLYQPDESDYHIYAHWTPIMGQRTWSANAGPWKTHPRKVEYSKDMCPQSLDLLSRAIHIDISPELTTVQLEEITEALHKVFSGLL